MDKEIDYELVKQRKFFEDILSGMKDWVRVVDKDNRVIFINEPMKKDIGDIVGQACYKLHGKKGKCQHCISSRAILEDKEVAKEEHVNGKIYSVVSSPIRDENGKPYCVVEVFRDVTEARELERLIIEQNRKMKNDLNFAKQLQHKILPDNKVYHQALKIATKYIPCELLGGDVYDVIEIDEENVGIYIADVCGHGVTSSMMTMFIRQTLKNLGERASDPAVTLRYLYHRYRELHLDDQYYITIFYGVYNIPTKQLTYANAGHNCMPILIRQEQVEEICVQGLPICTLLEDVAYEKKQISLQKGDKLLFYTDGISEAYNHEQGFLENNGVLELCRENREKDIENLIEEIIHAVNGYSTEKITDDIAMMIGEIL